MMIMMMMMTMIGVRGVLALRRSSYALRRSGELMEFYY